MFKKTTLNHRIIISLEFALDANSDFVMAFAVLLDALDPLNSDALRLGSQS
jgi:hypothetical protein